MKRDTASRIRAKCAEIAGMLAAKNGIVFAADGQAFIQVDVTAASLPTSDKADTWTLAYPERTLTPDYEGYETKSDVGGKTRYRLECVLNTDPVDPMVDLTVYSGKPSGAPTTIASGSLGTAAGSFDAADASGWPTKGFWVKNKTVNAGVGDCRYVNYRSGNTLYCLGVDWATLAFNTGTSEIKPGDALVGATSGATAVVDQVVVTSGTWAGGDAAGTLILKKMVGTFQNAEYLRVSSVNMARAAGASVLGLRGHTAASWAYRAGSFAVTHGADECIEGLQGPTAVDEGVAGGKTPDDLKPLEEVGSGRDKGGRRLLPGEEFSSAKGSSDPDDDESQAVDASKNQSVVPSSLGLTVCVDAAVETLDLDVRWGRYVRTTSEEQTNEDGKPLRAWKRVPSGGKLSLSMKDGLIKPVAPDSECPKVVIQGTVRPPLVSGERLITIFLINDQPKPDQNQDEAWLFQPEMVLRHPKGAAVFRRRPVIEDDDKDPERSALEMIYRQRVEFAVGHGISVHSETPPNASDRAVEVRTTVLPRYEVAITETPGSEPGDRPALRRMAAEGLLDMQELAKMEKTALIAALSILTGDYEVWIGEQRARIGKAVVGYDSIAGQALDRSGEILKRLREGILTLEKDDKALEAFRFANRAMALQRAHSVYALHRRRGDKVELADIDIRENRSWRPFQLAFILLSVPALANPRHPDRTKPVDAIADLLWFPTGGGKTEAYLGVAAFTMATRRLQGNLGELDASRGLSVIMRYTLRLLTVQQFQRATVLICAMETLRRADAKTWGSTPFTLGLWVTLSMPSTLPLAGR